MTKTMTPDRLKKIDEILNSSDTSRKNWVINFLGGLIENPAMNPRLLKNLVEIGKRAYLTTFIDDYDSSPNGLELSLLEKCIEERHNCEFNVSTNICRCLKHFYDNGNRFVKEYVIEFIGKNKIEEGAPLLIDLVKRAGTGPASIGYSAKNSLQAMDTEKSKKALEEIKDYNRGFRSDYLCH